MEKHASKESYEEKITRTLLKLNNFLWILPINIDDRTYDKFIEDENFRGAFEATICELRACMTAIDIGGNIRRFGE